MREERDRMIGAADDPEMGERIVAAYEKKGLREAQPFASRAGDVVGVLVVSIGVLALVALLVACAWGVVLLFEALARSA